MILWQISMIVSNCLKIQVNCLYFFYKRSRNLTIIILYYIHQSSIGLRNKYNFNIFILDNSTVSSELFSPQAKLEYFIDAVLLREET